MENKKMERKIIIKTGTFITTADKLQSLADARIFSSGIFDLDKFLPSGGYPGANISELIGQGKHIIAAAAMAYHSKEKKVAYISTSGFIAPYLIVAMGGRLENCYFVSPIGKIELIWAAKQIITSGQFDLTVIYGSEPLQNGIPLFNEVDFRKLFAAVRGCGKALLLLYDFHPTLTTFTRPVGLRLSIQIKADLQELEVKVTKAAGKTQEDKLVLPFLSLFPSITSWGKENEQNVMYMAH